MSYTEKSSFNVNLQPSNWLKGGVRLLFSLLILLVFFKTGLPLEVKTALLILLLAEQKNALQASLLEGAFYLDLDGFCRYSRQNRRARCVFCSPVLVILKLYAPHLTPASKKAPVRYLWLARDSFSDHDFRRLCFFARALS
ncbi:MAG: protein YgfX [Vibrionaceae bacterium]